MKRCVNIIILIRIGLFDTSSAQRPHTFIQTAHNAEYGSPINVAVVSDGTVFIANFYDGYQDKVYNLHSKE
jgi:hypothetical protein